MLLINIFYHNLGVTSKKKSRFKDIIQTGGRVVKTFSKFF